MTGKSHLVTNVSCAVVMTNLLIYNSWSYQGWQSDTIHNVSCSVLNAVVGNYSTMNRMVWIVVSTILFLIGSLLPDIDSPKSIISRLLHFHIPVEHRTWTHTIYIVIGLGITSLFFYPLMFMTLGFFLHLFWDSLSAEGCCFFYPFEKYRYYGKAKIKEKHILKLYHTDKASEYVLVGVIVTLTVIMCVLFAKNGIYGTSLRCIYGSK